MKNVITQDESQTNPLNQKLHFFTVTVTMTTTVLPTLLLLLLLVVVLVFNVLMTRNIAKIKPFKVRAVERLIFLITLIARLIILIAR